MRHLIQGIMITEFDSVKAKIMATDSFRTDYDGCVYLYKTFINYSKNLSPPDMNISGVEPYNQKGGGQNKHKGRRGGAVKDVYCS